MKIICAGLPKTGTKSLSSALRTLGYSVYDAPEELLYNREKWLEIFDGKHDHNVFKEMYKGVDAVIDLPACAVWDQILQAFPDAKVIFMERDSEDEWFRSFHSLFSRSPQPMFLCPNAIAFFVLSRVISPNALYKMWIVIKESRLAAFGHFASTFGINEMLVRSAYRKHNAYVQRECPKDQLLVYNVKEGWAPLCKFLNKPQPDVEFPHLNKNAEILQSSIGFDAMDKIKRKVANELKRGLFIFVVFVVGVATSVLWYFV